MKKIWYFRPLYLALAICLIPTGALAESSFDHSHASFTSVLSKHVAKAEVNYVALKKDPAALNTYLDDLARVDRTQFSAWDENTRMAYLINLYNAATLKLIIDNYPVKSIKDIGGFFKGPWKQEVVRLFGKKVTLDHVEHGILRKEYNEAKVHFALVCAAKGCPPLRPESYTSEKLTQQLDDQGRIFLGNQKKNSIDAAKSTIYLSPIFKWFSEDFEKQSGSVQAFVAPYFPNNSGDILKTKKFRIKYTDYDWSLNKQ